LKRKIHMNEHSGTSLKEVWESFIISQTSRGVSEATIKNYHNHLKSISHHIDIEMPMDALTKRHLEQMVVSMRRAGLARNSVTTYLRVMNTSGLPREVCKSSIYGAACALFPRIDCRVCSQLRTRKNKKGIPA